MALPKELRRPKRLQNLIVLGMLLSGCATPPIFPPDVLNNVDRTLTFATLKTNPTAYEGRKIELGGQIVGSRADQQEIRLLVRELPIQTQPVYGPVETGHLRGMFVVVYSGKLTDQDLQHGNMVVVVARVMGAVWDTMTGSPSCGQRCRLSASIFGEPGENRLMIFHGPPLCRDIGPLFNRHPASIDRARC